MISGTFEFGDDAFEIYQEAEFVVVLQQNSQQKIQIPTDYLPDFVEFLTGKLPAAKADAEIEGMVAALNDAKGITDWERGFVDSIQKRVESHGIKGLSEKQRAIVMRIYDEKVRG